MPWRILVSGILRMIGNIIGTLVYTLCAIPISESNVNHMNGFIRSYLIAIGCCILTVVYSIFFVRETHNTNGYI